MWKQGILETLSLGPDKTTWKKVLCRNSKGIVGRAFRSGQEIQVIDEGSEHLVKSDQDADDALGLLTGHVVAFPIFCHTHEVWTESGAEKMSIFHQPNALQRLPETEGKSCSKGFQRKGIKAILIVQNIKSRISRNSLFLCRASLLHISIALDNVELAQDMQARADAMAYLASNAAALTFLVLDNEGKLVDSTRRIDGKGGAQDDCAYDTQGNRILFHITDAGKGGHVVPSLKGIHSHRTGLSLIQISLYFPDFQTCKTTSYEQWFGTKALPCTALKKDIEAALKSKKCITRRKQKLGGMTRINSFSGHAVFRDASTSAKERKKM